jgi:hypothetical protein
MDGARHLLLLGMQIFQHRFTSTIYERDVSEYSQRNEPQKSTIAVDEDHPFSYRYELFKTSIVESSKLDPRH